MMTKFADSHAHLTAEGVFETIDSTLNRAQDSGIDLICNICTDHLTLDRGLKLKSRYPWIYTIAATTPHDVADKDADSFYERVDSLAKDGLLAAIGETGLDYYYEHSPKERQKQELVRYLKLAKETQLPIVIHCRDAFADLFSLLDANPTGRPVVLHCFTGTVQEAEEVLKRGWYLSLSGIATFKKSEELREVAKITPLDQLLIETDTPYLAPHPYRGKQNEPAYLVETAKVIASVKEIELEQIAMSTRQNCIHAFNLETKLVL